jgi:ankyrin repeat protein
MPGMPRPEGNTPLHCVATGDDLGGNNIARSNIARLLLEHGENVNARENTHSTTLHLAAQYGRAEVLHVLLEHVAIPGAVDDESKAAFHEC